MNFLYSFFISLMVFGLHILSLFDEKVRKGILGRKNSLSIIDEKLKNKDVIWMHASSLGEYKQGLPVLEKFKKKYPEYKILITFFSPSGYENLIQKNHIADAVCYLPFDRKSEIKRFISKFKTKIFFTIKYDFWYNILSELKKQGAKTFVVSAFFYKNQVFFKFYGKWFVNQLKQNIDWFFHQNEESLVLAKKIGLNRASISGDTRYDRVKQNRDRDNFVPFIKEFKGNSTLIVFGSSWGPEEQVAQMIAEKSPNTKIIIAPHDLRRNLRIKSPNPVLKYSELLATSDLLSSNFLVIDCIGLLSRIYSYADIAVVGGGFHAKGLHNILEAATFGVPVMFGNYYRKNPEADGLIKCGGGNSFATENDMANFILLLLNNKHFLHEMSQKAEHFILKQPNYSEDIISMF